MASYYDPILGQQTLKEEGVTAIPAVPKFVQVLKSNPYRKLDGSFTDKKSHAQKPGKVDHRTVGLQMVKKNWSVFDAARGKSAEKASSDKEHQDAVSWHKDMAQSHFDSALYASDKQETAQHMAAHEAHNAAAMSHANGELNAKGLSKKANDLSEVAESQLAAKAGK